MGNVEKWFGGAFVIAVTAVAVFILMSSSGGGGPRPPSAGGAQRDILREPRTPQEAYCGCFERARSYAGAEGEKGQIDGVDYRGGLNLCRNLKIFDSENMGIHAWSMGWKSGAFDWSTTRNSLEDPPPRTCTQGLRLYRQSLRGPQ